VGLAAVVIAAASPASSGDGPVPARFVPMAAHSGACTSDDSNATTVVIDYQSLGGGVQAYCANNLPGGATGLTALQTVASVQGTVHDGSRFVCRINSSPGPSQTLTLPNGDTYVESCANTPPASAYWSYWRASQGGSWSYSSSGAIDSQANISGYEGWSFSLGGGIGSAPAPRMAPAAWVVIPPPPPPVPEPPPAPAPPPVPNPPPASILASQPGGNGQTTAAGRNPAPGSAESAASDPAESAAAELTPSESVSSASSSTPASPRSSVSPSPSPSAGVEGVGPWGAAVGVGLILLIGAAAVIVWRRRSTGSIHSAGSGGGS